MSTTIDEKVVEMRFDNANFESNVKTSMSTLEKLKNALKFKGASDGLENIQRSASKVNFSVMTNGIDTVTTRFSYLQATIQHQLNNIVDSAVNAGKRMVSALTIDPVKSGLEEYETQINSVQTILSNTRQEGTTVEIVNKALDELNTYADKTIYNFTEMTRNIGTFTAAGVKLDTSVNAIKGIANLAAVSGSTSQQASTAMYQLSQALAAGKVQLMDWNSVVNAGMGGKVFQDALIRTSELLGTGAKKAIKTSGSFRESLTKSGWLTTKVLTETLNQFANVYSEAELISQGFTKEQAKEIKALSKDAEDAATKVKTFTQLWDVMKEAAQSGWSQTWRLIIGDFEEAKNLLTPLADFFTNVIGKFSDARNNLLEGALSNNPFSKLAEKIDKVTGATEKMKNATKEYEEIVNKVIRGDYGNGQSRFDKLAEEGYNWAKVQNMVNEKLGNSYRYNEELNKSQKDLNETRKSTIEDLVKMSDAELKHLGFTKDEIEAFRELEKQSEKTGIPIKDLIEDMDLLNGRTLLINSFKNIGQGLISVLKAIGKAYRDIFPAMTTFQLYNIIAGFHKFSTYLKVNKDTADNLRRTLRGLFAVLHLVTSITGGALKAGFTILSKILGAFDLNILDVTARIGDAIVAFHDWVLEGNILAKFINGLIDKLPDAIARLKKWFAGFKETPAVEKFVTALAKIKKAFTAIATMKLGSDSILKWIKNLKEALVELVKSIPGILSQIGSDIVSGIDGLTGGAITKLKKFLTMCSDNPQVQAFAEAVSRLSGAFSGLFSAIVGIAGSIWSKASEIGNNIIEGLQNGLSGGIGGVISKILEVATNLINAFCDMLGIHSPSTVAFQWGKDIIQGLINGLASAIGLVAKAISKIGQFLSEGFGKIVEVIGDVLSKIDWSEVFTFIGEGLKKLLPLVPVAAALILVKKLAGFLSALDNVVKGFGGIVEGFKEIEENFAKVLKAYAFDTKMEGLKKFATAIAILVGSIVVLTLLDQDKMYNALGVVVTLSVVLAGLMLAMDKISSASAKIGKGGIQLDGIKSGLISIGASLLMLAVVAKIMGTMNPDQFKQGFLGLAGAVAAMAVFIASLGLVSKFLSLNFKNIAQVGSMMVKLAIAMGLIAVVIRMLRGLTEDDVLPAIGFAAGFVVFVDSIVWMAKSSGNNISKVGSMMIKIAIAAGLMIGVIRLLRTLNENDILPAIGFATCFGLFIAALIKITKIGKKQQIAKLGGLLLSISISMAIMVGVIHLLRTLNEGDIKPAIAFCGAFVGFVWVLKKVLTTSEGGIVKMAGTLLAISVSIAILAGIATLLGMLDFDKLMQGTVAVSMLGVTLAIMIKATEGAQSCVGNLIAMSIAVGILGAIVALLSMIDYKRLIAPTIAIGVLMGMFALIELAAGKMQTITATLLVMSIAVAALGGILYLLSSLPAEQTLPAALALSIVMLAFSGAMTIIQNMQGLSATALVTLGVMALVVAALGGVLYLLQGVDPLQSLGVVGSLSLFLVALTGAIFLINHVGSMSPGAIVSLAAMTIVTGLLGGVLYALQGLNPGQSLAMVGVLSLFLAAMIAAIGLINLVGSASVGGIVSLTLVIALTAVLAAVLYALQGLDPGQALGIVIALGVFLAVMTGVCLACSLIGSVAAQALIGALILVTFIGALGLVVIGLAQLAMDVIAGMPQLGSDLSAFMTNLQGFLTGVQSIPDDISGKIGNLCTAILKLTGTDLLDSIASFFTGKNSLADLGAELKTFGDGMASFVNTSSNIDTAVSSIKKLSDIKGAVEDIDLGGLKTIGKSLKNYSENVAEINISAIITSVTAAQRLKSLLNSLVGLDASGVSNFNIKPLGKALDKYSSFVSDINIGSIYSSITVANRLKSFVSGLSGFDASGISKFKVKSLGEAIKNYSSSVSGVNVGSISSSISAANKIKSFISSLSGLDTSGVSKFKSAVSSLGKLDMSSVASSLGKSTAKFSSLGSSMTESIAKGFSSRSGSLTSAVTRSISSMLNAVTSRTGAFQFAGSRLMAAIATGLASQSSRLPSIVSSGLSSAASTAYRYYSSFYSAGSFAGSGLAAGMRSQINAAASAAAAMASAAASAARANLKINSPSKVFRKIGTSVPEGFALGIGMLGTMVRSSVQDMTDNAIKATSRAIVDVYDLVNSDIESQPTIRPIIDLADVEAGAASISGMFNDSLSVGATANIGAITSMMNERNQNGTDDVVSAINKLRKDISNIGGNYYNVNGITYDDGSNVSEAVKTIIRAARVERRI